MLNDKRLLVYLFVALRLTLLVVYLPEVFTSQGKAVERGLTALGDFHEHYTFAVQITPDNLPYRDYWVEFPLVWIGLAALVAQIAGDFSAWASLVYLVLLVFDVGNLLLVGRIAARVYDEQTALGLLWVYALLAAPLVMLGWNFEAIVGFSLLAGFYWWLNRKNTPAALVIGLGILTKFIPVLLLVVWWRFAARRLAVITLIGAGVALALLVAWGGEMAWQSLTVQAEKPSYQTVWALVDGNYGTGSVPGGAVRYSTQVEFPGNPPLIPGWLRLIPFGLVGLWVYRLPIPATDPSKVRFLTLTLTLFMVWSPGWSPQWVVTLLPWLLLCFPNRGGVLLVLVLMAGAFFEYPVLFRAAGSTWLSAAHRLPFALLILLRTAILVGVSGVLGGQLSGKI